jgi:23S rRNA (guanosine2251-2'-O)-methyltransferase
MFLTKFFTLADKLMKKNYNPPRGNRLIMGQNCVNEVINFTPERIVKLYVASLDDPMKERLKKMGIQVSVISKQKLSEMANSDSHQSIIAEVKERNHQSLKEYIQESLQKKRDLVLVLDSINDPQNLGTLLRSAECFGVGAVIWSKNRGCDITPVVSKASVGATELINIIKVSNLVEAVRSLKDEGYEAVTAEVGKECHSLYNFKFPDKTVLIMGSEGEGVRALLSKQADYRIFIPMKGRIDSLNVSQATSVFLSSWQAGCFSV